MKGPSPIFMASFYMLLGIFLIFLASNHVGQNGWGAFSLLIVALAAYDFFVAIRLIRLRKTIKKMQKKD